MEIGIFAKTFVRESLTATLDAVLASGLRVIQFNMACAGLASLPETIPPELVRTIRRELAARDMRMAAVSGTFNVIHPDREVRAEGMRRLRVLAAACPGDGHIGHHPFHRHLRRGRFVACAPRERQPGRVAGDGRCHAADRRDRRSV